MADVFCVGVGALVMHIRHRQAPAWLLPPVLVGAALAWRRAEGLTMYVVALCLGTLAMLGASYLATRDRRVTLKRAVFLVLGVLAFEGIGALVQDETGIPSWLQYAALPLLPVILFGLPVAAMLLIEDAVRRKAWLAAPVSTGCFIVSWVVWIARDHYYLIKYPR
jgi:cytochrome bd-type quinol oxidase subunit 2